MSKTKSQCNVKNISVIKMIIDRLLGGRDEAQ